MDLDQVGGTVVSVVVWQGTVGIRLKVGRVGQRGAVLRVGQGLSSSVGQTRIGISRRIGDGSRCIRN